MSKFTAIIVLGVISGVAYIFGGVCLERHNIPMMLFWMFIGLLAGMGESKLRWDTASKK